MRWKTKSGTSSSGQISSSPRWRRRGSAALLCQEYLSFAGFAALVAMAILFPGFLCLLLELFLLYAGSRGRSWCPIAAYLLQVAAALPSLFLLSIDPVLFDDLLVYPALMVLGIIGLLQALVRRRG